MTEPNPRSVVLVTVSGPDAPGITSELTGVLAESRSTILDIGQAVIHGLLSLSILFEINPKDLAAKNTVRDLLFKATQMGLKLDFQEVDPQKIQQRSFHAQAFRYAVTLIADRISAQALHEVTALLATSRLNIDQIQRLSENEFGCVEMLVSSSEAVSQSDLKKKLLEIAQRQRVDIALQAEGLFRRAKRLVVFDLDSTLIQHEFIDELARAKGVYEDVAKITASAMRGEINYDQSLRDRVKMLSGLTTQELDRVYQKTKLTPGTKDLISVLKRLGYKIAVISGGFTWVTDRLRETLGLDYAYANQLDIQGGQLTGEVFSPIVNAQRKADLLDVIAQQERIDLEQVIAIGDGANDLLMLQKAGLGIAFNAKPVVSEQADLSLRQKNLKSVLYLLGISGRDVSDVLPN